jgi:hypothetical protein
MNEESTSVWMACDVVDQLRRDGLWVSGSTGRWQLDDDENGDMLKCIASPDDSGQEIFAYKLCPHSPSLDLPQGYRVAANGMVPEAPCRYVSVRRRGHWHRPWRWVSGAVSEL